MRRWMAVWRVLGGRGRHGIGSRPSNDPDRWGDLDLRFGVALADSGLCDVVTAGDPAASELSVRMHATDFARMPPLGTVLVDDARGAVVDEWISSLTARP